MKTVLGSPGPWVLRSPGPLFRSSQLNSEPAVHTHLQLRAQILNVQNRRQRFDGYSSTGLCFGSVGREESILEHN